MVGVKFGSLTDGDPVCAVLAKAAEQVANTEVKMKSRDFFMMHSSQSLLFWLNSALVLLRDCAIVSLILTWSGSYCQDTISAFVDHQLYYNNLRWEIGSQMVLMPGVAAIPPGVQRFRAGRGVLCQSWIRG